MNRKAWDGVVDPPIGGRLAKPRASGWTMVIDKGLGLVETADLLSVVADCVDLVKLTFGTSAFYPPEILQRKTALLREHRVRIMPGGTFAEVALVQGRWNAYLRRAAELGFDALEVSDGTIDLPAEKRCAAILSARDAGFVVLSEVGKKHPDDEQPLDAQAEQVILDLRAGATKVIIEGRESGKGVGIYGAGGEIRAERLAALAKLPLVDVIWEAPLKSQQEELLLAYGPNTNLGNIPAGDVLALEALRVGLRGDTLRAALRVCAAGSGCPPAPT